MNSTHLTDFKNLSYLEDFEVLDLEDGFMVGLYSIISASKYDCKNLTLFSLCQQNKHNKKNLVKRQHLFI